MTTRCLAAAAILAAALFATAHVDAQTTGAITLTPERPTRWDVAGQVGWLGVNKSGVVDNGWNDWYDAAAFTASAGYYWTSHLKTEAEVTTATRAEVYTYDMIPVPAEAFPYSRQRRHFFRYRAASGGVSYQFFDNAWFHPFVGAGVDVVHESTRTELAHTVVSFRDPRPPLILPAVSTDWEASVRARPFATAGFKWYVSENAFVRSELRSSFSSKGGESVVWRAGVGVDF
jgi:hypothetical protein